MAGDIVSINNLRVSFPSESARIYPVDGVSLKILKGETLGLVGESGCGKSMTSLALMGLLPRPLGRVDGGEIIFKGRNLIGIADAEMAKVRGRDISMIFQDPMTSLNPVYTVGDQIIEAIQAHERVPRTEARRVAVDMLRKVGIPSPEKRIGDYPHLMSGGMRQRVMIAMALSLKPELLIADEPTTALDVTIQAQILYLMNDLRRDLGMSILLITHNMGLVAENADRIAVMYAGRILEEAPTKGLFASPLHPYSRGLLDSIPRMTGGGDKLQSIPGMVPPLNDLPKGCKFFGRCARSTEPCETKEPPLFQKGEGHSVRCWLYEE
ncbi:ABC transporter ATP-binding protein [Synergistales bacterium]|nr:ABC transporter ATP-binding protein [Synergistales bacterium]